MDVPTDTSTEMLEDPPTDVSFPTYFEYTISDHENSPMSCL